MKYFNHWNKLKRKRLTEPSFPNIKFLTLQNYMKLMISLFAMITILRALRTMWRSMCLATLRIKLSTICQCLSQKTSFTNSKVRPTKSKLT